MKNIVRIKLINQCVGKLQFVKNIKELLGLGLKDSKDIVDNLPHILKEKVLKEEAEKIKKEFDEIGGNIILKE